MAEPVYTIDAGAIFVKTKESYLRLSELEEQAEDLVREARRLVFEAEANPRADEYAEQLDQARALLAQAELLVPKIKMNRVRSLMRAVNNLGATLARVRAARENITLGEKGFAPHFDKELSDITARYENVYRPLFPIGPGGKVELPDPDEINEQLWDLYYRHLEGPLFLWDYNQCLEEWNVPGVPRCTGPDYLRTLSLVNQVFVAWENQDEIRREFPIISFVDEVLGGHLEESDEVVAEVQDLVDDITDLVRSLVKIGAKVARTIASAPGWLIVGGGIGLFLLSRRRR